MEVMKHGHLCFAGSSTRSDLEACNLKLNSLEQSWGF